MRRKIHLAFGESLQIRKVMRKRRGKMHRKISPNFVASLKMRVYEDTGTIHEARY